MRLVPKKVVGSMDFWTLVANDLISCYEFVSILPLTFLVDVPLDVVSVALWLGMEI